MKLTNITNKNGKPIANQFIIIDYKYSRTSDITVYCKWFQSYGSIIALIEEDNTGKRIYLDSTYWKYSPTTSKYRNKFLNETTAETQSKIDSGEYTLTNLN